MASKSKSGKNGHECLLNLRCLDATLLEENHEVLATEFKTSFSQLDVELDQTRLAVEEHRQRVLSLELGADDLSQQVSEASNICSTLQDDNSSLKAKVANLES